MTQPVTLESLHADYEAKAKALFHQRNVDGFIPRLVIQADNIPEERKSDGWEAASAARLYLIARNHGLEAAMLYRLSDGAIDPREGGEE